MTSPTLMEERRERIARIIEPWAFQALHDVAQRSSGAEHNKYWKDVEDQATRRAADAYAKADAILSDDPSLVLREALEKIAGLSSSYGARAIARHALALARGEAGQ